MSNNKSLQLETADVVVIGGGVIGLTIARALRKRGVREVMLVEREQLGAEASWAAGGILAPQVEAETEDDFFRLACASRDMYPGFAAGLKEESGIDVELDTTGTIWVAFTQDDESELNHCYEWQRSAGFSVERLDAAAVRQLEPDISPHVRSALLFPNDIQVENRLLLHALIDANKKSGVRLVSDCEVRAIQIEQDQVRGIETSIGLVSTSNVVVAAGAWTSLIKSSDQKLPSFDIEPVRGQMLCFAARVARHVIYSPRGYLVPRRDGRLLAGSTNERVGFERRVTEEGIASIKSMAHEIVPALERMPLVDSWAGFRPHSQDDLPVIGPGDATGLFYATGHYRNGILLAPITGELIAEAVVSGGTFGLKAFSPRRFGPCPRRERE